MRINKVLAALNNPTRRDIIVWLKDSSNFPKASIDHDGLEGVSITTIQKKSGLSQSTISNYMALLKEAELVVSQRHGKWTFFKRNERGIDDFILAFNSEILLRELSLPRV